eukprot:scaffold29745_cov76-Phaeocystis_antarctica.AAC.6
MEVVLRLSSTKVATSVDSNTMTNAMLHYTFLVSEIVLSKAHSRESLRTGHGSLTRPFRIPLRHRRVKRVCHRILVEVRARVARPFPRDQMLLESLTHSGHDDALVHVKLAPLVVK